MVDFDGLEVWDCFRGLQRAIHRAHRVQGALHCDVRPYQWLGVSHLDYPDRVRGTARLVYLGGSLQFDRGTGRCKHRKELRKLFEWPSGECNQGGVRSNEEGDGPADGERAVIGPHL